MFQENCNLFLSNVSKNTDATLDNKTVAVEIETFERAKELIEKATDLKAVCEIINND